MYTTPVSIIPPCQGGKQGGLSSPRETQPAAIPNATSLASPRKFPPRASSCNFPQHYHSNGRSTPISALILDVGCVRVLTSRIAGGGSIQELCSYLWIVDPTMRLRFKCILGSFVLVLSTTMFIASTTGWLVLRQTELDYRCQWRLSERESPYCFGFQAFRGAKVWWTTWITIFTSIDVHLFNAPSVQDDGLVISIEYPCYEAKPLRSWGWGRFRIGAWESTDVNPLYRDRDLFQKIIQRELTSDEITCVNSRRSNRIFLEIPVWVLLLAFAAYPAFAFLRGPVRRWRRRRRNFCIHCGYNLTGNTTDICSECGKETTKKECRMKNSE